MEKKSAMDVFMEQQSVAAPMEDECCEEVEMEMDEFTKEDFGGSEGAPPPMAQMQASVAAPTPFPMAPKRKKRATKPKPAPLPFNQVKTSEQLQLEKEPIRVRETGFAFWKLVIVPPNAYVVHTRIGKKDPVTLGLGISFRYNPNKDAYLIIPASMQTIGVVANCISKEKQGINILAYVQWQINDISIAYKRLDFSDSRDPLGIFNAQLREQAEAAIKDKIATMSVEEVLTDKAPIIDELTKRLKAVTEENKEEDEYEGLGIKIITVQIREAFVSSQSLWTDLQSPFRYEQTKAARLSYLDMQNDIKRKELDTRKQVETREAETRVELQRIQQQKETEALQLRLHEEEARYQREQESTQKKINLEEKTNLASVESRERVLAKENEMTLKKELEIIQNEDRKAEEEARITLEADKRAATLEMDKQHHRIVEETRLTITRIENRKEQLSARKELNELEAEFNQRTQEQQNLLEELKQTAALEREQLAKQFDLEYHDRKSQLDLKVAGEQTKIERLRQEVRNLVSDKDLFGKLIKELPQIARELPKPDELKIIASNDEGRGMDGLVNFLTKIFSVAEMLGIKLPGKEDEAPGADNNPV